MGKVMLQNVGVRTSLGAIGGYFVMRRQLLSGVIIIGDMRCSHTKIEMTYTENRNKKFSDLELSCPSCLPLGVWQGTELGQNQGRKEEGPVTVLALAPSPFSLPGSSIVGEDQFIPGKVLCGPSAVGYGPPGSWGVGKEAGQCWS
jgi:hypothetical protein